MKLAPGNWIWKAAYHLSLSFITHCDITSAMLICWVTFCLWDLHWFSLHWL